MNNPNSEFKTADGKIINKKVKGKLMKLDHLEPIMKTESDEFD